MNTVKVLAPAKLNLALDVVGLLPNGYHDLDMIMQTVDLYETIILRKSQELTLTLPGSRVPAGENNTATKAALAFFHYTGLLAGVNMEIRKTVPVRAGMAGGSADAAGVLVGLNTCRVRGVGDLIKALPPMPDCWLVVVMPSFGISTPEAFARYDQLGSTIHPDCEAQERAIRAGDLGGICAAFGNALEECSGAVETPHIRQLLDEAGALASSMTGSGAAVFGIFDQEEKAASARATLKLEYRQVYLVRPCKGGARVLPPLYRGKGKR